MSRPLILGTIGAVIVVAALALTFYVDEKPKTESTAVLKSRTPASGLPVSDAPRDVVVAPKDGGPAAAGKSGEQPDGPVRPSFDVVRVNPRGDAVIAGRAAPNAEVVVRDGKQEVGKVKADSHGEWVLVPKNPLHTGNRELTLSARSGDAAPTPSDENVVIVVPERGKSTGGKQAPGPLAVLMPRDGEGGSVVLQRPGDTAPGKPGANDAAGTPSAGAATGSGPVPLSIDAVDYDEAGHVTISGHADPNAKLNVYIENEFAGAGTADKAGRWRLVPGGKMSKGLYTLRVDQVDPTGNVTGRAATQFARSSPVKSLPGNGVVFVEPGNSLWRIARRVYGKGMRYSVIYAANREQIRDPNLIYPGQVFFVPHVN